MGVLRAVLAGIIGLFVDDGSLALALLAWTAVAGGATWTTPGLPPAAHGAVLFLGYLMILLANVARTGRDRAMSAS